MKIHKGNYTHGLSYTPLYKIWKRMMYEVEHHNTEIDPKWRYLQDFVADMDDEVKGAKVLRMVRQPKYSAYNKENCKFKIG